MKINNIVTAAVAAAVLAVGLGIGSVAGADAADAAPSRPGFDVPQKPHHGHWGDWDDWVPGPGPGHWVKGGWFNGVDACVSATGPYGNVAGFICI